MTDDRYRIYVEQEGLWPYWIPCDHEVCNDPHEIIDDAKLLEILKQFIERKDCKWTKFAVIRY